METTVKARAPGEIVRRTLLLAFGAALAGGCTLTWEHIELGTPLDRDAYEAVRPGADTLGTVLERLGPPDDLDSNPREEVLVYRHGIFRGTDLSFKTLLQSLPGISFIASAAGVFQQAFELAAVDDAPPDAFPEKDPLSRLIPMLMSRLAGSFNLTGDLSTHQVLDLRNRQVRYDTIRVVIDRGSGLVREKSFDNAATGDRSWVRATFLQE